MLLQELQEERERHLELLFGRHRVIAGQEDLRAVVGLELGALREERELGLAGLGEQGRRERGLVVAEGRGDLLALLPLGHTHQEHRQHPWGRIAKHRLVGEKMEGEKGGVRVRAGKRALLLGRSCRVARREEQSPEANVEKEEEQEEEGEQGEAG